VTVSEPVPDLLDTRGRLRRAGIAGAIALIAAAIIATICYAAVGSDIDRLGSARGAWKFVIFMTGFGFAFVFVIVHWLLARAAKRRHSFVPRATLKR
jgi:hypothetical protein